MHNYSIDNDWRKKVIVFLMFISILLNFLLYNKVNSLIMDICSKAPLFLSIVNFLESFGTGINILCVLTIFAVLYWLYTKYIWKYLKRIHSIPDLSGEWKGKLISSYINEQGEHTEKDVKLIINQNWNKISIKSEFGTSYSYSDTASICIDDNKGLILVFTYINQAKELDWESNMHIGCNVFRIMDNDSMAGEYFTKRGKLGTNGIIELTRVK